MKIFLYDYQYDGKVYGLEIPAHNREDADLIIKSLPSARYAGELQVKIPVMGWLTRLLFRVGLK